MTVDEFGLKGDKISVHPNYGACPNCGKDDHFFINAQARGTALVWFEQNGKYLEIEADETWFLRSTTVRCGSCLKVRRDLIYNSVSGEVEEKGT